MGSCKDSARVAALKILGIETSCDETGIAIYDSVEGLIGEALFSQVDTHARFGGVVPELASRDHIARSAPLLCQVVADAGLTLQDLDAIAYTAGPGLVGALMVGGSLAASLAFGLGIPAIPIHHLEAHLLVARLEEDPPDFPFLALLVSGGHTLLVHVQGLGAYRTVGNTLDDAAGEAFDKVARLLSLPYPGGPALEELAAAGDPKAFDFPRPMKNRGLDFSFSGLKTAVRLKLESETARIAASVMDGSLHANIAASFQAAVVDTLVHKSMQAMATTGLDRLVVAGGVGANKELRQRLRAVGTQRGFRVYYPRPAYCTDNGAMIAYAGWCRHGTVEPGASRILARPRWPLDELAPGF
jgi:N6-L-threonylcarbamoyladenine synthase